MGQVWQEPVPLDSSSQQGFFVREIVMDQRRRHARCP